MQSNQFFFFSYTEQKRVRRDTVAEEIRKWPAGIVPYMFGFTAGLEFLLNICIYDKIVLDREINQIILGTVECCTAS